MLTAIRRISPLNIVAVFAAALCIILISFTAHAQPSPVRFATGAWPWYTSGALTITPETPLAGEATEICANMVNPTGTGYSVILRYYVADFGIGAAFNPITDSYIYLPPSSTVKDCIQWVPPSPGPWSFQARLMTTGYDDEVIERNIDLWELLEPLAPDTLEFTVRNPTAAPATITLGLVPQLSGWGFELSQDVIPNLPSGGEQAVNLITTPPAVLPTDGSPIVDVEAYIGATNLSGFRKIYISPAPCNGARLDLTPDLATVNSPTGYEERGIFVSAIRGFQVCAVGMEVDLQAPQTVTARIYEANGTTRGTLLTQGTATAVHSGKSFHFVPLEFELLPCHDYDISFEYGPAFNFDWFDERTGFEPFDVGGVIRVRDAEFAGNSLNFALPKFSLIGFSPGDYIYTDLATEGLSWNGCGDGTTDRGVYVTPHQTITMTAMEWAGNYSSVPVDITAHVYDGTGRTRGNEIATGTATVTVSGLAMHRIPIATVLEEGKEYDLAVTFPATSWSCIGESQIPVPFTAGGVLEVNDGESGGNPNNSILSHFAIEWAPSAGGMPFSLTKITEAYPPPFISTDSYSSYGLFLTSLVHQEIYSLGWEADVHAGELLTAWVYEASGTSRGALVSVGEIIAVEGQTRWHDIPVAVTMEPDAEYNIEIGFAQMNQWAFWEDYGGMPYVPYGLFEVYAASQGGSTSGHRIIHMRVSGCNASATAIEERPAGAPRFTLDAPYPNPVAASATLEYSIDVAGPVTIAVYDVAGRRVTTLLDKSIRPAGPGRVELDTRSMAAGVYFVKMELAAKSVSRRITVVR